MNTRTHEYLVILFLSTFLIHNLSFILASDWPQLGCNPQRTSYTPDEPKPPFTVAWEHHFFPHDRMLDTVQAIIYEDKVYVGSKKGVMYCLALADGAMLWQRPLGWAIEHTAAANMGKVFTATMEGIVFALDAGSGEIIWQKNLESMGISAAPMLVDNTIYIGARGGDFVALSQENGGEQWRYKAGAPIMQSPAHGDGKIFFTPEDKYVRCLDARTGEELWRSSFVIPRTVTLRGSYPVVSGGQVFISRDWGGEAPLHGFPSAPEQDQSPFLPADNEQADVGLADTRDKTLFVEYEELLPKHKEKHEALLEWRRKYGSVNGVVALRIEDGKPGVFFGDIGMMTMARPRQPPAVGPDGAIYMPTIVMGWSPSLAAFDPGSGRLKTAFISKNTTSHDETHGVSMGGDMLFLMHAWEAYACGTVEAWNLADFSRHVLPPLPQLYGRGETKSAPPANAPSISGQYIVHCLYSSIGVRKGSGE